jgi:hypothetical protein
MLKTIWHKDARAAQRGLEILHFSMSDAFAAQDLSESQAHDGNVKF